MGLGQERFVALAAEFQASLQRRNAILFLGRGVDDETAKQIVSSYEWRMRHDNAAPERRRHAAGLPASECRQYRRTQTTCRHRGR